LVQDKISQGEAEVQYRPTGQMWADYMTKPLQGSLFQIMRDHILNCHNNIIQDDTSQSCRSVLKKIEENQQCTHNRLEENK